MSKLIEIKIPDLGGADEVEIVEVLVQPGDVIELEQTLAVMESDKATMDLPASASGTVQDVKIKVGDKVGQGTLVALLNAQLTTETAVSAEQPEPTSVDQSEPTSAIGSVIDQQPEVEVKTTPQRPDKKPEPVVKSTVSTMDASASNPHATPSVRLFARELGVDLTQITQGSGRKGRILREDIQAYVKNIMATGRQTGTAAIPAMPEVDFSQFGEIEVQELGKIKRLTGEHMVRVCLNVPMVTQHDEADITEMEAFRKNHNANKPEFKLTGLVFVIKALTATLKQFPQFNSSLSADGTSLIYKKYFNIGIAVETPNGLVVPVIRSADQLSLNQLSAELVKLSTQAREGKLSPAAMSGGSISISSLGGIGGRAFTPIVNAPEVAILGVSRSKMQPIWDGENFVPRLMLPLDLTYDHRVIDGAEAARFLVTITQYLSDIRRLLL